MTGMIARRAVAAVALAATLVALPAIYGLAQTDGLSGSASGMMRGRAGMMGGGMMGGGKTHGGMMGGGRMGSGKANGGMMAGGMMGGGMMGGRMMGGGMMGGGMMGDGGHPNQQWRR